jgi:hypothetical protein
LKPQEREREGGKGSRENLKWEGGGDNKPLTKDTNAYLRTGFSLMPLSTTSFYSIKCNKMFLNFIYLF